MSETANIVDYSAMTDAELARAEKEIARKYIGGVPWAMVIWCFGNLAIWISLFPLVIFGMIPLWLGFCIACVNVAISYLPSHEAQHSNIAKPGHSLRWLNELVGRVSTIPIVLPYGVLRITHMKHHAHTNDPELDPDYQNKAPNWWMAIWNGIQNRQSGDNDAYGKVLEDIGPTPEVKSAVIEAIIWRLSYVAFLIAMAWSGFALEAFFLWFLPKHVGITHIILFLSWAPHVPFEKTGRYKDTRAWRSKLGNIFSQGMQYHVVHHLHPAIPLFRNGAAYWEMRDILLARGIQNDGL